MALSLAHLSYPGTLTGGRIVRALFAVAALKAPTEIILDEIDGLLLNKNSEQDRGS